MKAQVFPQVFLAGLAPDQTNVWTQVRAVAEFLMPGAERGQEQAGELEGPPCLLDTGVDWPKGNHSLCSQCLFVCWIFCVPFFPQAEDNVEQNGIMLKVSLS